MKIKKSVHLRVVIGHEKGQDRIRCTEDEFAGEFCKSVSMAWLVCAFLSALVILPTGTTKARKDRKMKRNLLRIKKFFCSIFSTMKKGICKVYEEIFSEEYIED